MMVNDGCKWLKLWLKFWLVMVEWLWLRMLCNLRLMVGDDDNAG